MNNGYICPTDVIRRAGFKTRPAAIYGIVKIFKKGEQLMTQIKNSKFLIAVSTILIATFIALDISYACPGTFNESTLAAPSMLQESPVDGRGPGVQLQGALLASIYDIAEYFFREGDKNAKPLPARFAESNVPVSIRSKLADAGMAILNIVPVEHIKRNSPEEFKAALETIGFKAKLPDEGVVFVLYVKDGKRFLIQIARSDSVPTESLPGYDLAVSDKYMIKYIPESSASLGTLMKTAENKDAEREVDFVMVAEGYLMLGDTAAALRAANRAYDKIGRNYDLSVPAGIGWSKGDEEVEDSRRFFRKWEEEVAAKLIELGRRYGVKDFEAGVKQIFYIDDTDRAFSIREAPRGAILPRTKPYPDAKALQRSNSPTYRYNGKDYTIQDRWVPKSQHSAVQEIDEEQLLQLALTRPGWKVVVAEDYDAMTYGALYVAVNMMQMAHREFTLGLATGGTTESYRKALGLIDESARILGGLSIPADKVNKWSTLDNYYWPRSSEDIDVALSSYTQEQQYMLLGNLYGKVDYNYFVTPFDKTSLSLEDTAQNFRMRMRVFLELVNRILVQIHGIGSDGHDGFSEIYARLALLRRDYGSILLDITRVQNIGHFLPEDRSFHPFFLRFMADNYIFSMDRLVEVLDILGFENIRSYYSESKYQFKTEEEFRAALQHVIDNYKMTPAQAITQGTGDIAERTGNEDSLNLFLSSNYHKAVPTHDAIELAPSRWNTASALQLYASSLVIVDLSAAVRGRKRLDLSKAFLFAPKGRGRFLAKRELIEDAWRRTKEGRRIQELLKEKHGAEARPSEIDKSPKGEKIAITTEPPAQDLFDLIERQAVSNRAEILNEANEILSALPVEKSFENMPGVATLDKDGSTAVLRNGIESVIALVESPGNDKVDPQVVLKAQGLKARINQLDAGGLVSSAIKLASQAEPKDQKLIIGLETDWIPGMDVENSLQRQAIAALMAEIHGIAGKLRSIRPSNVEIVCGNAKSLAGSLMKAASDSNTDMRNVFVMASKSTITSDSFKPFRDAPKDNKPFLTGIDPEELAKLYRQFGESVSSQLYIKLTSLLCMALEAAAGKEPPQVSWIKYDSVNRILIIIPGAEVMDCEKLKDKYKAELGALQAA